MKVIFFGTSKYCLPVLEALKPQLKLVVTREDKPVGRKQILTPSATKVWAQKNNIPVEVSLRGIEMTKQSSDLAIIADYGKIIRHEVYEKPKLGTFNIHFSKLPEFRGPSPVQSTLLRGDKTAWITIYKLKFYPELKIKMDSGPILWQKEYPIDPNDTTESLYTNLFKAVASELPRINFEGPLIEQDHKKATFCKMLTKQDGFVEWKDLQNSLYVTVHDREQQSTFGSEQIYNLWRAMTPWPGLWTIKDGKRMKILKCHLDNKKLVLDEVQFEGKTPQKFSDNRNLLPS